MREEDEDGVAEEERQERPSVLGAGPRRIGGAASGCRAR